MPQLYNKAKGDYPTSAVYIGRGSPWGNPFVIGKDGDRETVIKRFESEVLPTLDLTPLRGKSLVCVSAPQRLATATRYCGKPIEAITPEQTVSA